MFPETAKILFVSEFSRTIRLTGTHILRPRIYHCSKSVIVMKTSCLSFYFLCTLLNFFSFYFYFKFKNVVRAKIVRTN